MTVRWNAEPTLRRPALVAAFSGWNDAADAASRRRAVAGPERRRAVVRDARHRGVPRLPGRAARPSSSSTASSARSSGRRSRSRPVRRPPAAATSCCCSASSPTCAGRSFCDDVISVARTTGCEMVVTLGALLGDVPHSRPMRVHRLGDRRGARGAARHGAVALRGTDRHRRRAARRRAARRASRRRRSGRRCRTTSRPRRTRRRRARCSTGSAICSTSGSTSPISTSRPAAWERSVDEVVAGDADASSYVERLEHRYDEAAEAGRPTTTTRRRRRRRRRRGLARRGRPPVGRIARRGLRALPPRAGRRVAQQPTSGSSAERGRGRGRPRGGSRARATRCRPARRCRGTSTRSRRTRACG